MMGNGWGMGGWGMLTMTLLGLLVLGLLVAAVMALVQGWTRTTVAAPAPTPPDPAQILAARFARGEIDEEDYRSRLAVLSARDTAAR